MYSMQTFQRRLFLVYIRLNLFAEVCGHTPLSSFNYVLVTCHIMRLFRVAEDSLRGDGRHKVLALVTELQQSGKKGRLMFGIIMKIMSHRDELLLRLFANVFETLSVPAMDCVFWDDLKLNEPGLPPPRGENDFSVAKCAVM